MAKKPVKRGVERGTGVPPFAWSIRILDRAFDEAMQFLDRRQYRHLAQQFQELARQADPTHSDTISLDDIEDFHELRDWGGMLHPRNVRIYFGVEKSRREIIVLGAMDKKNDGATPLGVKSRMRRRWRRYRAGDFD